MHEFRWLESVHMPPTGTLEDGIMLANHLQWNISWGVGGDDTGWYVYAGESLLLKTDSKEVAEAFLYGLELAYSILPDVVFQALERNARQVIGGRGLGAVSRTRLPSVVPFSSVMPFVLNGHDWARLGTTGDQTAVCYRSSRGDANPC